MNDCEDLLKQPVAPDAEGLKANLLRKGTPERVFFMELYEDKEIKDEVCRIYEVGAEIDPDDPHAAQKREIALQRFLGYDTFRVKLEGLDFDYTFHHTADTTPGAQKRHERDWMEESRGPVATWEDFEKYPWPDPSNIRTDTLEWYARNLPDDMCICSSSHSVFENVTWLMGYETLCLAIFDQPDFVDAMFEKVGNILYAGAAILSQMPRVDILFGGDDMGFKTGTMIQPDVLEQKALPWHKKMARLAHDQGKIYMLHSCGNLAEIMEALIEDVKIDGKHSFEDVIETLPQAKKRYGDRIAIIGGLDVDLLCRGTESQIRSRVREVVEACQPGGGFCLGSGNTIANYVPVRKYLVMLDEGRKLG